MMKNIINFLTEAQQKTKKTYKTHNNETIVNNPDYVRKGDKTGTYKSIAEKYLEYINKDNALRTLINNAIEEANNILKDICEAVNGKIEPSTFLTGQAIGRLIETTIANAMSDINGFAFKQGGENSTDKDITCVQIPNELKTAFTKEQIDYIKKNWQGGSKTQDGNNFFRTAKYFGIELKSLQQHGATGNKAYASGKYKDDDKKFKDRSSFYLIINYAKPHKNANPIKIENLHVYFGFLDQSDWSFYDSGSSAVLDKHLFKDGIRLIKLI